MITDSAFVTSHGTIELHGIRQTEHIETENQKQIMTTLENRKFVDTPSLTMTTDQAIARK